MRTCINFGEDCVGCDGYFGYCIDERRCYGQCHDCINHGCENNPHYAKETEEMV
jgi:hypothetical protein